MTDTLTTASAKLAAIERDLADTDALAQAYAEVAVKAARRKAAGHPTPQSRMAASVLTARNGALYAAGTAFGSGGSAQVGGIFFGSEFGSSIYRQFGSRRAGGAWMYPSADSPQVAEEVERTYVADLIAKRI